MNCNKDVQYNEEPNALKSTTKKAEKVPHILIKVCSDSLKKDKNIDVSFEIKEDKDLYDSDFDLFEGGDELDVAFKDSEENEEQLPPRSSFKPPEYPATTMQSMRIKTLSDDSSHVANSKFEFNHQQKLFLEAKSRLILESRSLTNK